MNFWFYPNMVTILTIGLKSHGQNGLQLSYLDPFYFFIYLSSYLSLASNKEFKYFNGIK